MGQTQPGDVLRRRRGLRGTEVRTGETVYNRTKGGGWVAVHGLQQGTRASCLPPSTRTSGEYTDSRRDDTRVEKGGWGEYTDSQSTRARYDATIRGTFEGTTSTTRRGGSTTRR